MSGLGEVTVREAVAGDAPAVATMLHDFNTEFGEPSPGAEWLATRVGEIIGRRATFWLLAFDSDRTKPVGMAQVSLQETVWSERPVVHLDEFYVVPDRRGGGIGRLLLGGVLGLGERHDAAWFSLETGEDDRAARHLYEAFGFVNRTENEGSMLYYERSGRPD